jgi:uncharacterized protein (DUF305 family)
MKKYLPNNSELRIAIFSAIATVLLLAVGHIVMRGAMGGMHGQMGMRMMDGKMGMMGGKMNMDKMHRMGDGSMMMDDEDEMDMSMMGMTMGDMVGMLEGKKGKDLEKEFIIGMIPHHQGAVDMAKKMLEDKTISAEMKKFAEDIIRAQEGEIKMMGEWLKKY